MAEVSTSQAPDAQLFRDAFNASPIGIAVENLDGQPLFVNPAFCRFLGFTEKELCSKHCVDFSPREDAEKDWALFQQLKAGSIDHYQMEKRYFRRDGSLVWGSLSISLLKGRSSPLVLAMVEDITEKKAAEEARFRDAALVESSDDAIATGNLDGMIVTWNAGAEKMYGYTEAEAIGKPITMLVPPELPDEENKILETLRAGGRIEHFETIRVTKTGKRINVSLTISPIKDSSGKIVGISGIARDITERKQVEETLRKSEERLRLAAQAAKMYSFEWDVTTDAVLRSPEHTNILGVREWSRFTHQQFVDRIHPDDRTTFLDTIAGLTPENPSSIVTYRFCSPNGAFLWLRSSGRAFFDSEGKMLRVIGMVADVTEQKLAEEALRASEERRWLAQQAARIGAFERDVRTGRITWAEGLEPLYGLSPGSLHGKTIAYFKDLIHPDDWEQTQRAIQEALTTGQPTRGEWRAIWPDGSVHWIVSRWQVLMDDSGQPSRVVGVNMDVTDRKLAEDALRESEERLRLAQWAAHIGTFDLNLRTGVDIWPPETEALYGLPPGGFGGTLTAFENLIHPDDRGRIRELAQEMMKTGQPTEAEWRVIWPDGSVHWIASRGQVLMDESGEPSRMLGVNMDVTERKHAEQALCAREELLKIFVKNVPAAVAMLDRDMRYLQVSDRWCSDYLHGREQAVGYSHYELFPDMPERWKEVHRRALAGETLRANEDHWVGQDGPHWARWEVLPWKTPDGTVGGILILAEDITERKRAEEAVKESETRFRLVADTAPVMIWMSGIDKKPTYFNQPWLDFTGFSEIDLQNRLAEIVHPEDYPQCHEVYCRGFDQRQPFRKECRLRRHDGQYRWMLDIGVPRFHKDGSFAGYIGSCTDVTEHKQAEEALASMSRKLIEAQEQERTRIARELHDDINQRLALLSVELEASRQNPPDTAANMSIVLTGLRERINEISSDVQSISHRLHSSQLEYLGIVAAARSFCREFSTSQNVEVDFSHDDIPRSIPHDISLCLFRVLQEALHNAVKYSQARHVKVRLSCSESQLGLMVSDHGIGFDPESALHKGGLGLTSMKERVRLINGTISIESKPMHGTTIHVRVPLTSEHDSEELAG